MDEKLPGRGLWIEAQAAAVRTAADKNAFSRAAKRQVSVDPNLAALCEGLLLKRCTDVLSLSRKAGQAVCGFTKVESALRQGDVTILLEASDGAADGRGKILSLARGLGAGAAVFGCLSADELGAAFGRQNVIHAALSGSGLSSKLGTDLNRLAGFREKIPASWEIQDTSGLH